MRDAARGLGVSEVARPAQVSGVLAAMVAARGSSMRSTRLTSLITTSSTVQYSTVQYTVLSTVPDHHVGLGLGREGVEARHQTLDLVRHAVQLARGSLYSRDTLLEIGNANGIGIFLEVNKIIITIIVFDSSLLHIILLKIYLDLEVQGRR